MGQQYFLFVTAAPFCGELIPHAQAGDWLLTRCISFVVMVRCGASQAPTSDRPFEQAGFVAMLAKCFVRSVKLSQKEQRLGLIASSDFCSIGLYSRKLTGSLFDIFCAISI